MEGGRLSAAKYPHFLAIGLADLALVGHHRRSCHWGGARKVEMMGSRDGEKAEMGGRGGGEEEEEGGRKKTEGYP
jgi:hypothetical protein